MPVFFNNRIYVTAGGDIWWGKRKAWLKCIDATKSGDITDSGEIWSVELERGSSSTPAISNGLVYITDCGKKLHCIDADNGQTYWTHNLEMDVWGSALAADNKIYVGSRGGDFWILEDAREKVVLDSANFRGSIHSTPVAANSVLYISTGDSLYAVRQKIGQ